MYSIEFPVTVRIYYSVSIDRAVAQYYRHYKECSKVFNQWGQSPTSVIPWKLRKWVFCEIFRTHIHTLRLVSPWGRPGNPADHHTAQRGYPMAQRLPLQSPQHTQRTLSFRNRHTHGTQRTQPSRMPQGPHRLQDCKYCQPTESITKCPEEAKYRESLRRQIQREKPSRGNTEKSLTKRQRIHI